MLEKIFFKSTEQMFKRELIFNEIFSNPLYFQKEKYGLKAIIVDMSPYDYMDIVKTFISEHKVEKEKLDSLHKAYNTNKKVQIPYLEFGERDSCFKHFGQEGYNRAYTSTMIGKEFIPVAVRYRENDETIPALLKDLINLSELKIKVFISGFLSDKVGENRLSNIYLRKLITGSRKLIDKLDEDKKIDLITDIYDAFDLGVESKNNNIQLPFYLEYEVEKVKFNQSVLCVKMAKDKDYVVHYDTGGVDTFGIDELRGKMDYKSIDSLSEHLSDKEITKFKCEYLGIEDLIKNNAFKSDVTAFNHKFARA